MYGELKLQRTCIGQKFGQVGEGEGRGKKERKECSRVCTQLGGEAGALWQRKPQKRGGKQKGRSLELPQEHIIYSMTEKGAV